MNISDVEKIEKILLSPNWELTLKNVVTLGRKNRNNEKMDALWSNTYDSNKYNDRNQLTTLRVDTGDFLVFSLRKYGERSSYDLYLSYPHMENLITRLNILKDVLINVKDLFFENEGELYMDNKYDEIVIRIENLTGGSSMMLYPDVITDKDDNQIAGVVMILGSEENYTQLTYDAFFNMVYFLENFNLNISSNTLLNIGISYYGMGSGGSGISYTPPVVNSAPTPSVNKAPSISNRAPSINSGAPKINKSPFTSNKVTPPKPPKINKPVVTPNIPSINNDISEPDPFDTGNDDVVDDINSNEVDDSVDELLTVTATNDDLIDDDVPFDDDGIDVNRINEEVDNLFDKPVIQNTKKDSSESKPLIDASSLFKAASEVEVPEMKDDEEL